MRKRALWFVVWFCALALSAQPPEWEISVPPVYVTQTHYDYMNGGYADLPLAEFPLTLGGGRMMTYHARRGSYSSLRKVYFNYIDGLDQLQPIVDPWQDVSLNMGFPSLAFDPTLNRALFSWHESHDADTPLEVVFMHEYDPLGVPGLYSNRFTVFDPPAIPSGHENDEFIWPSIKTGPSPNPGMRRVYILARNNTAGANGNPINNVMVAYADYDEALLNAGQNLNWTYNTIPLLDDWQNYTGDLNRRMHGSFAVGDDGRIYYAGYHYAYDEVAEESLAGPDLDVFVCDNYGAGAWQHYSLSSRIPSSNPWNPVLSRHAFYYGAPPEEEIPIPDEEIYYYISNSSHFNLYTDSQGKLHMPGLWMLCLGEQNYAIWEATTVKEAVFDPDTHEFSIREVYPVAGTSSDDLWWMPWDTDGDLIADNWPPIHLQPEMTLNCFPWCHWDLDQGIGIMVSQSNYTRLTGSGDGTLVCLWQDSYKARMYHLNPDEYPQYAPYSDNPEIYLSVSLDNGAHWLEPIVFSAVDTPELAGMTPMWVYPSNDLLSLNSGNPEQWKRLFLMFLDDHNWGPALPPSQEVDWGNIMYMALDFAVPAVGISTPELPPAMPTQLKAWPNPFAASCRLEFSLPTRGAAELVVYNLRGQVVRRLDTGYLQEGEHSLAWDGHDDSGASCAQGIYLLKLSQQGKDLATRRITLLRR